MKEHSKRLGSEGSLPAFRPGGETAEELLRKGCGTGPEGRSYRLLVFCRWNSLRLESSRRH